jgi:hypothetical protein
MHTISPDGVLVTAASGKSARHNALPFYYEWKKHVSYEDYELSLKAFFQ